MVASNKKKKHPRLEGVTLDFVMDCLPEIVP